MKSMILIWIVGLLSFGLCTPLSAQSLEEQLRIQKNKIETENRIREERNNREMIERNRLEENFLSGRAYRLSCRYVAKGNGNDEYRKSLSGPSRVYSYLHHLIYDDKVYKCYEYGGKVCYSPPELYWVPEVNGDTLKFRDGGKVIAEFNKVTGKFLVLDGKLIDEFNCERKPVTQQ